MAVVEFDPAAFLEACPQFAPGGEPILTDGQLSQAFEVACLMLNNTNSSPVPYNPEKGIFTRRTLLYLIVCHLCTLALWQPGQAGPLASATEGSVSVSFSIPNITGREYWNMTPCGQSYWQAIRPYALGGRYYRVKNRHPWG